MYRYIHEIKSIYPQVVGETADRICARRVNWVGDGRIQKKKITDPCRRLPQRTKWLRLIKMELFFPPH